jgi:hypothetical protein
MTFVGRIQQLLGEVPPWYVRNQHVGTLLQSAGLSYDEHVESLLQGLRLSQPMRCDASALPVLSRDRGIRIYETEPEASKRYRLSQWWQLRRRFGTHQGELRNLAPYFLPAVPLMRIVHQNGGGSRATWHTLAAVTGGYSITKTEASNWDWDSLTAPWSRWWAILYRDPNWTQAESTEWDDGSDWDGGQVWDGEPDTDGIADIVAALKEAKAPHSKLAGVIVCHEPGELDPAGVAAQDPDGWWSMPAGNWGQVIDPVTGLPTRPPWITLIYDAGYESAWTAS